MSEGRPYRTTSPRKRAKDARDQRVALLLHTATMTKSNLTKNDAAQARALEIVERVKKQGNPEELEGEVEHHLFTQTKRAEKPWRDPDTLESTINNSDSLEAAGRKLGTRGETVSKWASVFGIRPKSDHLRSLRPQQIRKHVSPEDVGLETTPDSEGSA